MKNKFNPRKYKVIRINKERYDIVDKGKVMYVAPTNIRKGVRILDWLIITPLGERLLLKPLGKGSRKKMEFKVLADTFWEKDIRFRKTKAYKKLGIQIKRMEKEMKEDEKR